MTHALGLDLGTTWLRAATLVDDRVELAVTLPAAIGFADGAARTGADLDLCRAGQQLDAIVPWLARAASDGVAGVAWPVVDGRRRSPVELVAHLVRAVVVATEAKFGPVRGAVVAVPVALGALERRVLRDAVIAAGVPAVRLLAAPAAAALAVADDRPARVLVIDVGTAAVRAAVVEHVDGVIDVLAHARVPVGPTAIADACARALAAAAVTADGLSDAIVIGGGALDAALVARTLAGFPHAGRPIERPETALACGAARAARMFLDEPAAVCVDVIEPGFSLGAGSALTSMIPTGAIAPTREVRLIARDRPDRAAIDLELWEDTVPPRPYGRYQIGGLPLGTGAIAACEVTVDVDRIPRIEASDLVNGGALDVTPVVEVGLGPDDLAALRAVVTGGS
ncbi:MAG: Hsp70 family protein [Myxococcales bacterium]|nr:Hsp70 family protein [Myxococcales bacterium]